MNQTDQYSNYNWLPVELKLSGYNYEFYQKRLDVEKHGSRSDTSHKMWLGNFQHDLEQRGSNRYYQGAGEILTLLDQAGWPPDSEEDFLIWVPSELDKQRRDMKSFLYGRIGTYLYPRLSAELDLFQLCWGDILNKYVSELPEITNALKIPEAFTDPEIINLPVVFRRKEVSEENKKADDELINGLSPQAAATFGELIRDLSGSEGPDYTALHKNDQLRRNGACPELNYIAQQSDHPFLRYQFNGDAEQLSDESLGKSYQGISGTGLPLEIEAKINANLALQLRLKLWWGWPGAPFMCIERMMADSLAYLVRQGDLRHLGGSKYELPAEKAELFVSEPKTLDRLKEALKLLTPGKAAMTVGSTLAKGALSASAPYWINLGKHLLGL
jgi:hypothetical protein